MKMTINSCSNVFLHLIKLYGALLPHVSCSMQLSCNTQTATIEDIERDPALYFPQREDSQILFSQPASKLAWSANKMLDNKYSC